MTEIIKIIVEYAAIWAPSLVAILGAIYTVLTAVKKAKEAIDELRRDETLKDVRNELATAIKQNAELNEKYDLLLDELTKIKDFAKHKGGK